MYQNRGNETDAEHGLWMTAHVPLVGHAADVCIPLIGGRTVPSHKHRTRFNDEAKENACETEVPHYVSVIFTFGPIWLLLSGATLCLAVTFVTTPF